MAGAENGGAGAQIDTRAICLIRETLARHNGLADFAFAMQGLGSGAISLAGTPDQKQRYLGKVAAGGVIAALRCRSLRQGRMWRPWPVKRDSMVTTT